MNRSTISRLVLPLVLASLVLSGSGCYLGRSPIGKTVAYATNGVVAGVGTLMVTNTGGGDEQGLIRTVGVIPLAIGLVGIALNIAVGTEQPDPPRRGTRAIADGTIATALR